MNEIGEKYLPLGSVVLLKGATKRVMITGFVSMSPDTGKQVFDYSGCVYPEGFYNYNEVCVFNHNQIDKVYFTGLVDEEEKAFKNDLIEKVQELEMQEKQENTEM